jgi:hypothetical protein
MKRRFRVGEVFSVPVDERWLGYGQIVHAWGTSGGHFYFALFDVTFRRDETVELDEILRKPLAILALSMDALLWHGIWQVVGHQGVDRERFPFPAYKEGVWPPGTFDVVDYTGRRRRRASEVEVDRLSYRSVLTPIVLQDAFQALHHVGEWRDDYDELRPVLDELTSASVFGGSARLL